MQPRDSHIPLKTILGVIAIGSVFVLFSILGQRWTESLRASLAGGIFGMLVYTGITAFAVVVAPVSAIPLLPIATHTWGPIIAAILSIVGWTIGAMIAFWVSRRFGHALARRFTSLEKIQHLATRLPNHSTFWPLVFLRISLPVDILSYAVGLLTQISGTIYFFATLIGVAPFAFIYSYAGIFPWHIQLLALAGGSAIFLIQIKTKRK